LDGGKTSPPAATPKLDRPAAVAEAQRRIAAFRTSTRPGKWHPSLDRNRVADRLLELIDNPDSLHQASNGLCGEAAFFNVWLWEDPLAVANFGMQLFNSGAAAIGTDWVRPGHSLIGNSPLKQDFSKILSQVQKEHNNLPANWGAEWMMMSALRDANNYIISYDGTPSDHWGDGSSDRELARWLRASGLFRSVSANTDDDEEHNVEHALKLVPGNDIIMISCDSHMLGNPPPKGGKPDDDHWFVLRSAIIEQSDGSVDFRFWCWGEPTRWVSERRADPKAVGTPLPPLPKLQFKAEYFGYLIGER
jgi:hypothetical protein